MKEGMQFDSKQINLSANFMEDAAPIIVAQNEIVHLHMVHAGIEVGSTGAQSVRAYFNLKSVAQDHAIAPETENVLMEDKNTFWRIAKYESTIGATGALPRASGFNIKFDPPIVMIRTPRVIAIVGSGTGAYLNVFWYYTKEKISVSDLTKFMVKKHH